MLRMEWWDLQNRIKRRSNCEQTQLVPDIAICMGRHHLEGVGHSLKPLKTSLADQKWEEELFHLSQVLTQAMVQVYKPAEETS